MPLNCFTVDFEDWYHGIELPFSDWHKYEPRIEIGFYKVFQMLEQHKAKATFFTLGWVAEKYPALVKELSAAGHELASHSYSHEKVYNQSRNEFRDEIRKTKIVIEDLTGKPVTAHRSPFFSVIPQCLWALDILKEEGYHIDCSISPIKTWRYGIKNCPDEIFRIKENELIEFPVSPMKVFGKKLAIGGAYFRILPAMLTELALEKRQNQNRASMFYIHPWEYDPEHPKIKFETKAMMTHYARLKKTTPNTKRILSKFQFDTVSNTINQFEKLNGIRFKSIEDLQD